MKSLMFTCFCIIICLGSCHRGQTSKSEPTEEEETFEIPQKLIDVTRERIGSKAPSMTCTDLEGKTYGGEQLKDKIVVLNFWFTGCKPCVEEIPELNKMVEKYKEKENIVFLAPTFDSKQRLESFLQEKPFNYAIVPHEGDLTSAFEVVMYPTHVIIGRDGIIKDIKLGQQTAEQLEESIGKELQD